ncbi:MAG: HEPN domain-containing protein [Chitinispirillia bacterium]|nr:HEPN domain-containing protein [Chitinispirillia bacterium]MCL2241728.1 HEPN domain-containing protein [Chitinispirillia bacterium]
MQIDRTPEDLAEFRFEQAKECLAGAERELAADSLKNSVNRSYYAIFHAMRAVLAFDRFDSKKHSGIITAFHRDYIRNGIFPKEFSKIVDNAFDVRTDSDYHDFYLIAKAEAAAQFENAKVFLEAVESYINGKIGDR